MPNPYADNPNLVEPQSDDEEGKQDQPAIEPDVEPEIPKKFQGKQLGDVVKAYSELEKLQGRQAQELGQLRQLTDEILKRDLARAPETAVKPVIADEEVDFYDNPDKAVERKVRKILGEHLAPVTTELSDARRERALNRVTSKHSDWQDVVFDEGFQSWVKASTARQRMYDDAQNNYDADSAIELLDTYKLVKGQSQEAVETVQRTRARQRKDATLEVGGTGESSRKLYRRADLIRLRIQDPERYAAMQDEIMSAYHEGRVR